MGCPMPVVALFAVTLLITIDPSSVSAREPATDSPYPHQVLRSPRVVGGPGEPTRRHVQHVHPPHHPWHQRAEPLPASLPQGWPSERWKSPYSYGYFGASGSRHWTRHHGHRDRYLEWRWR